MSVVGLSYSVQVVRKEQSGQAIEGREGVGCGEGVSLFTLGWGQGRGYAPSPEEFWHFGVKILLFWMHFECYLNSCIYLNVAITSKGYYTNSGSPDCAHNISTDIRAILPPFTGDKMSKIMAQILTPIIFGPPYFWSVVLYRKTKTNLSRTDDRFTSIPKSVRWVLPTLRTVYIFQQNELKPWG